jgi:hypothetical protein
MTDYRAIKRSDDCILLTKRPRFRVTDAYHVKSSKLNQ